jgi:choice-of-anchor B domain-containing protein
MRMSNVRRHLWILGLSLALPVAGHAQTTEEAPSEWLGDGKSKIEVAKVAASGTASLQSVVGSAVPCSGGMASGFECKDIDLQAYLNKPALLTTGNLADIWGWTDPVTFHEYALVTHGDGTTFVDITDPVTPVVVGRLPMHEGASVNSWRDVKTYGNYAFVVADNSGPQGMQIFDLTELRDAQALPADSLPVTFSETAHYAVFATAHNIAINDSSGTAFVVGARKPNGAGSVCGGGIHIVDISIPTSPDSTGCYADPTTGRGGTGYTHDIQCVKYHGPDNTYTGREICFASNETAVLIADVTDNANPVTLGKGEYPDYGYVHQGWLTDDHRYFVQDDELDEYRGTKSATRTLFWDVSDLTDPVLEHEYEGPTPAIDHNQYVVGSYLYQAQYKSGVRIVDISGVTEAPLSASKSSLVVPTEVAFFDTYPASNTATFAGAWSVYPFFDSGNLVVSSIGEGMFVLRPWLTQVSTDITVFLEGPYMTGTDSMKTSASFKSQIPTANPYQYVPFVDSDLEHNVEDSVATLPAGTVDWVQVELRTGTDRASAVMTRAAMLLENGHIVDLNGNTLTFPGVGHGHYYVVVRHRNHLAVMSSAAVDMSLGSGAWDFSSSSSQAFGANPMKGLGDGKWGLYAGEADINGLNSAGDYNSWLIDTKSVSTGYAESDFNMDAQVLAEDFNIWLANTKTVAASQVPE